jgi:hypothetical protein
MAFPKRRGRSCQQTSRRARRMRKISTENSTKRGNLAKKIPTGIQNPRQALFKMHFIVILKELRNLKHIEMQIRNQSNILENKALVHSNGVTRNNFTS